MVKLTAAIVGGLLLGTALTMLRIGDHSVCLSNDIRPAVLYEYQ
jgi:hypothetical protein